MESLTLSYAAKCMQAILNGKDCAIKNVVVDSRQVMPGDLFIALPGAKVDGHDYVAEAAAKGAIGAVVSRSVITDLPTIQVADTVLALGQWAKQYRQRFQIPVVAITGSCGKTTVKEMLSCILAEQGEVLSTQGNMNTEVGVPLTLLRLLPKHEAAIIEMGARNTGDIQYLMSIAAPTVSLITNAGVAHLEIFGSKEGIAKAKGEIYEYLDPNGTVIINVDDPNSTYWQSLRKPQHSLITFGLEKPANVTATQVELNSNYSEFTLVTEVGSIKVRLSILGLHSVQNALSAAAAASALGISLAHIKAGLERFSPVTGRLQLKKGFVGANVIDDTYNANPVSVRAALAVLAHATGSKVFVMGDMFELGPNAAELHIEMGEVAKKMGVDKLLGVGALTAGAVQAFGIGASHYADKIQLINALRQEIDKNTTVLVKGSRGMRMEEVVLALTVDSKETSSC